MEDKEFSMFFEVICCYHPTEFDPTGKDGLYIKEVRKLDSIDIEPKKGIKGGKYYPTHEEIMKDNPAV